MGLQHTPALETQPLLKHPKPEQTLPCSGMLTRSKSRLAAAPLQAGPCQGGHQPGLAHCQAVPEIPDGPVVISAGWGRTGTSSLKVQAQSLHCLSRRSCALPVCCRVALSDRHMQCY